MNNIDYLNKITATSKPQKSASDSLFSSKPLRIFLIAAAALAFIIIIVGLFSNLTGKEKSLTEQLSYRLSNLNTTITTYSPYIKSPALRSSSTSLSTTLKATSTNLSPFLANYGIDPKKPTTSILNSEVALIDSLNTTLKNSQLNGLLDRTYAREIAYQISLLITLESELYNKTADSSFQASLYSSIENLNTLYPNFNDFSETK